MFIRRILLIVIGLILSSCNAGTSQTTAVNQATATKQTIRHLKSNGLQLPYTMGGTYDSMSGHPTVTLSCLNAGMDSNAIKISNPQASLNFTEEQSFEQVLNALGINIAVTIGWGPFSVTDTYHYAKSSQDDAFTLNLNYIYKYAGTAEFKNNTLVQGESALTSEALGVFNSPTQFRTMCGDRFVSQMDAGATVLFRLKLKFNSAEEKNYFTTSFTQIHGLSGVLTLIMANPNKVNFNLEASGMQVGGVPSQFNSMFAAAGGIESNGYMTVNCGNQTNTPTCVKLINNVLSYTQSISGQLSNPGNFYLSNPTLSAWSEIGVYPGGVTPNPQALAAMQALTRLYNTDQDTYKFIKEYTNMLESESFLSSSMSSDLHNLAAMYEQILFMYMTSSPPIMDCYDGFISDDCITVHDNIVAQRQQILNDYPSLLDKLSYIESNEYIASLLINPANNTSAICGLYPITGSSSALFLINCNGQVSGSFTPATGTSITPGLGNSLQINNLNYTYTDQLDSVQPTNQFSYQISQPLFIDGFYQNTYLGSANVLVNNVETAANQNFSLGEVSY